MLGISELCIHNLNSELSSQFVFTQCRSRCTIVHSSSKSTSVDSRRNGESGRMLKGLFSSLAAAAIMVASATSYAQGSAGLLSGGAQTLPPITLSSGMPLADEPYVLQSGEYYEIDIVCDGSAELAISGSEFFRNVWVDEVVINDIEIRPLGLDSLEFDDEGTATIKFIAIKPGRYEVRIPGTTGETQKAVFTIQ